jgi:hypothetical protein
MGQPGSYKINYIAEEADHDEDFKSGWVYDTGVSVHICNDWKWFVSFKSEETAVGVDDTQTMCEGIGNVVLYPIELLSKALGSGILLKRVRYSLGFYINLFLVLKGEKIGI